VYIIRYPNLCKQKINIEHRTSNIELRMAKYDKQIYHPDEWAIWYSVRIIKYEIKMRSEATTPRRGSTLNFEFSKFNLLIFDLDLSNQNEMP